MRARKMLVSLYQQNQVATGWEEFPSGRPCSDRVYRIISCEASVNPEVHTLLTDLEPIHDQHSLLEVSVPFFDMNQRYQADQRIPRSVWVRGACMPRLLCRMILKVPFGKTTFIVNIAEFITSSKIVNHTHFGGATEVRPNVYTFTSECGGAVSSITSAIRSN